MTTRLHREVPTATRSASSRRVSNASANVDTEHILLETGEAEFEGTDAHRVLERFTLKNRVRRLAIELVLFEGGWLSFRERRRAVLGEELIINLRALDPKPVLLRVYASTSLRMALYLMTAGVPLGWIMYRLAPSSYVAFALGRAIAASARWRSGSSCAELAKK